jgi:diacylglycerol kinase family enzyme
MPRIFWGGHIHHPAVRVVRTQWVRFEPLDGQHLLHADGEPLAMAPATLRIEAQALRVIQPTVPSPVTTYHEPQT